MRYFIYANHDWSTTHNFLTFIESYEADDYKTGMVICLLNMILKKRAVPLFVEETIDNIIKYTGHFERPLGGYIDISNSHIYFETILEILENQAMMEDLYYMWTEEVTEPLVVIGGDDICASFIFRMFPPHHKIT